MLARPACPGLNDGAQLIDMAEMARLAGAKLISGSTADNDQPHLIAIAIDANKGTLRLGDAEWADENTLSLSLDIEPNDAPSSAPACVVISVMEPAAQRIAVAIDGDLTTELELAPRESLAE